MLKCCHFVLPYIFSGDKIVQLWRSLNLSWGHVSCHKNVVRSGWRLLSTSRQAKYILIEEISFLSWLVTTWSGKKGEKGEGFDVLKSGDARVAMIGFPSVGKSTLLSTLTKTESSVASYEFTTLTCIPGVIEYKVCNNNNHCKRPY